MQIFSLGYRCSSAGILKYLGVKSESYPFDWLVSRLPIVEHCIQTDFKEFLNPDNYKCIAGVTNHYSSLDPASQQWICNESVCFNQFYESGHSLDLGHSLGHSLGLGHIDTKYYLPRPVSPSRDAYGYKLMMNHRNIQNNPDDREYFARCVNRWKSMCESDHKKLSLYIHPAIFYEEFITIRPHLIEELRRAYKTIQTQMHTIYEGIFIVPVKTPFEQPTNHCAKYVLEEQPDDPLTPGCRICILWTNRDFIDAGEIFMGNCHVETYVVNDYLQKTIQNGGLVITT